MTAFLMALAAGASAITAPGPNGPLAGTLVDAGNGAPVVLIVPGSGPTDRDGNSRLGISAAPYRLLAEALANKGVATVRIDKRGMFGSAAAVPDPNAVTIGAYAEDVHAWAKTIRAKTGARCVWVLGHSEGGLIALVAAQRAEDLCGIVLVATPGRKVGTAMRDQLRAQLGPDPAKAALLDKAMGIIGKLEHGQRVEAGQVGPDLWPLFAPQVQAFLINMMAIDPARLAATTTQPMLVVGGGRDLQVPASDAAALAAARGAARLVVIPTMNHVLKEVASDDRAANVATYANPSLPLAPTLVDRIAAFVKRQPAR